MSNVLDISGWSILDSIFASLGIIIPIGNADSRIDREKAFWDKWEESYKLSGATQEAFKEEAKSQGFSSVSKYLEAIKTDIATTAYTAKVQSERIVANVTSRVVSFANICKNLFKTGDMTYEYTQTVASPYGYIKVGNNKEDEAFSYTLNKLNSFKYNDVTCKVTDYCPFLNYDCVNTAFKRAKALGASNVYLHCIAVSFKTKATSFSSTPGTGNFYLSVSGKPNFVIIYFMTKELISTRYLISGWSHNSDSIDTDEYYNQPNIKFYKKDGTLYDGDYYLSNNDHSNYNASMRGISYTNPDDLFNSGNEWCARSDTTSNPAISAKKTVYPRTFSNYDESQPVYVTTIFNNMVYNSNTRTLEPYKSKTTDTAKINETMVIPDDTILVDGSSTDSKKQKNISIALDIDGFGKIGTNSTAKDISDIIGVIGINPATDKVIDSLESFTEAAERLLNYVNGLNVPSVTPDITTSTIGHNSFFTMFKISDSELDKLSSYMWSSAVLDNLKKMFNNPIDAIISLSSYPFPISASSNPNHVILGNTITDSIGYEITDTTQHFSLGSIKIKPKFDDTYAYLDYSPYTKITLFIPCIGLVDLNANDVMDSTITVDYYFELISGNCIAVVKVKRGYSLNNVVLYQFSGNVATQLPVTGRNFSSTYSSIASAVAHTASLPVTGGIGLLAVGNDIMNMAPTVERGGQMSGSSGLLGGVQGYAIIQRPICLASNNYGKVNGYIGKYVAKVSECSGYVSFDSIDASSVNIPTATESEKAEIESLLKSGVYV